MRAVLVLCLALLGCTPGASSAADDALSFLLPRLAFHADEVVLSIEGPITDDTVTAAEEAIAKSPKRLNIQINSPGGSVDAGLKLIRLITKAGVPTVCTVQDEAASMAAVIFESSACGRRVAYAHSIIMFHQAKMPFLGTLTEQVANTAYQSLRATNLSMAAIVSARLGISVAEYQAKVDGREWWLTGVEMLASNVADEIR